MTGYQEILTDPSYCRQIVTLTYPHIGNYGTNAEDVEAARVFAAGLVIQNLPLLASNFRSEQSLQDYLRSTGTVAIANIDTRRLTRHLRLHGAQKWLYSGLEGNAVPTQADINCAIAMASAASSMVGLDLAREVSCAKPYAWTQANGYWARGTVHLQKSR